MPDARLPEHFRDLEPWLAWALPTETERSNKRQASTFAEIRAFYDTMLARGDEALGYLQQLPVDALPDDARLLFYLTLSLAEVAPAVEQFGQPSVVDGFDIKRITATRT